MRWSLISALPLLALAVGQVSALPAPAPAPNDVSSVENLEARARARAPFKAKDFKASSSTYRKAAARSKNHVFSVGKGGKLNKQPGNGKVRKGLDADHIVEAQTVAHAANKARRKPSRAAVHGAKKILNGPKNMAFLDKKTNNRKGKDAAAGLKGRKTSGNKNVQSYMRATKKPGIDVAKQLNAHFKKHRTPVNVLGAHRKVLKANRVKRELASEENLDVLD
jgi:hypothetical protein